MKEKKTTVMITPDGYLCVTAEGALLTSQSLEGILELVCGLEEDNASDT